MLEKILEKMLEKMAEDLRENMAGIKIPDVEVKDAGTFQGGY
jgi:hypothetical protein